MTVQEIQELLGVDHSLATKILRLGEYKSYPAGTVLNSQGSIDRYAIFLSKGICKYAHIGKNKNEIIFQFGHAPQFLPYSTESFFLEQPATISFTSITPIEGLVVSAEKLLPFIEKNPALYNFFFSSIMKIHQRLQTKEIDIIMKSITERYLEFKEEYHEIFLDIPLKSIASYLNIQPGSLSRIRKNLNS